MTVHVCILGIDGSGKSSVCKVLPRLLAAEYGYRAGSCSDGFTVVTPEEDVCLPGFEPRAPLLAVRLARHYKRKAKRHVNDPRRYPVLKLAHLLFQDSAAAKLAARHRVDVMVTDGDLLLSVAGRAANYRRPASESADADRAPDAHDIAAAYACILDGKALPAESRDLLPSMGKGRTLYRACRALGIKAGLLPDVVVFLDLSPATALERITSRGAHIDRHENLADLEQARGMYNRVLDAYQEYKPESAVVRLSCDEGTIGVTLRRVMDKLGAIVAPQLERAPAARPLGTTAEKLTGSSLLGKILNFRYVYKYLLPCWFRGAWREPCFAFSAPGRRFLREGYSAGVMKDIYELTERPGGWMQRAFLDYPLHRAVFDRVQILRECIASALEQRAADGRELSVFSAPSGYAFDLFGAVERLDESTRGALSIRFLANDLDPHGVVKPYLRQEAGRLGVQLQFVRADLTESDTRRRYQESTPFDIALFVGLSSWLPKPETVRHLKWLRSVLRSDGLLVTDCFTPAPYALSGKYVGYKAHYYEPEVFSAILDACGFAAGEADVHSGRDSINHVLLAAPRC